MGDNLLGFFEICCVAPFLSCFPVIYVLSHLMFPNGWRGREVFLEILLVSMSSYQTVTLANSEEYHRNGNCITEFLTKVWFYFALFIVGNSNTSLIAVEPVRIIHILSMPNPMPPVGGIPISRAFKKSSSV